LEINMSVSNANEILGTLQAEGEYRPLPQGEHEGRVTSHAVQTVRLDPQALYALWRDVDLIPRWQERVISVTPVSETVSHWVMGNPRDESEKQITYDAEITEDVPGERIAWRSISGDVEQNGSVTFEATGTGRGTLVTLIETVKVPLGSLGNAIVAVVKRSPSQMVIENLRHFKQLAETGEIPSVEGQPHGPRGLVGSMKEWMYGETNPTPAGTSDAA
jgi:uncharacterized membrane protein